MHFSIYVKSASTTDHSTLLPYSLRVGSGIITEKKFDLHSHIDNRLVEGTKMLWYSCILERLI